MSDSTDSHPLERDIFYKAFEIEDTSARIAYLDEACGDDTHLRSRLDVLFGLAERPDLLEPQSTVREIFQGITQSDSADYPFAEKQESPEYRTGDSITLIGKYELLNEIARGGMGIVYKARQQNLNRIVALKLLRDAKLMTPEEITRFRMEAEFSAALDHPNIVPIYEVDEHEGHCWFSMKLIEGGPVNHRMFVEGGTKAAVRTILKITRAVQAAHGHGILHRDIKPGNILIDQYGEPHLTDFGIAKFSDSGTDLTLTGEILGTPLYMSPEQARGERGKVSVSSDVYSLGAVLYELVSGEKLFDGESSFSIINQVLEETPRRIRSQNAEIDSDLDTIIMKCLEKEPSARYSSAEALGNDLEAWLNGEPISARPVAPAERFWKWTRRKPIHAALLLIGTLFGLVLAIGGPIVAIQQSKLKSTADRRAEELRRGLYVARMNLASVALEENRGTDRILAFLEMTDQEEGKTDLRNWEWFYLKSLLSGVTISQDTPWKCARWSPDGTRILTSVGRSGLLEAWDGKTGRSLGQYEGGHTGQIESIDWSPDGSRIATASWDKTARIWDSETGQVLHTFQDLDPRKVAWSPDGKKLATFGLGKGGVRLWNPDTGELVHTFSTDGLAGECLSWSPDSSRLIMASFIGKVRAWNVDSQKVLWDFFPPEPGLAVVEWSRDGTKIGMVQKGENLLILDPETGREKTRIFLGERENEAIRWSHDDRFIAVGGTSETVHVWEVKTGRRIKTLRGLPHRVDDIDWSPDDRYIAAVGRGLRVWDFTGQSPTRSLFSGSAADSAKESPDGKFLAVANRSPSVSIYDTRSLEKVKDLTSGNRMAALSWSQTGGRMVAGGEGQKINIWDPHSGNLIKALPCGGFVNETVWSPDGQRIAYKNGTDLVVYDANTWEKELNVNCWKPIRTVDGMDWSPDGQMIAAGGQAGKLGVFDSRSGALLYLFPKGGLRILSIDWHPGGDLIAVSYDESEVTIWSMKTLSEVARLPGHLRGVISVAWNPDGSRLASGGAGGFVRIWNSESWEELISLGDLGGVVRSVSWSADGERLTAAGLSGKIVVWDAGQGYEQQ